MTEICLRFYETSDASALFEAARESITEVNPWIPWCHTKYRIEDSREWIASQVQNRQNGIEYHFAIVDDDGAFLGGCGLNRLDPENLLANLGYWVRSSATGRGVASRAARLLADWAFKNTKLERLEIVCAVGNIKSQRAAEKTGALREGVARSRLLLHGSHHDAVIFSFVRKDFELEGV